VRCTPESWPTAKRWAPTKLLHDSRRARAECLPPFATPLHSLTRVPQKEEMSDAAPRPVTGVIEEFLAPPSPHRVLLLLGDGGVGKSLTLQHLARHGGCIAAAGAVHVASRPAAAHHAAVEPRRAAWFHV
jgi:hypothetical protein